MISSRNERLNDDSDNYIVENGLLEVDMRCGNLDDYKKVH